jgi:DNA-binding MarR family transcriptional regulator
VGEVYGLSGPERRCLSSVSHGPQPANAIAKNVNLPPAAVTTLIDRLETRGFVRRQSDPDDRRKVMAAAAEKTDALIEQNGKTGWRSPRPSMSFAIRSGWRC